MTNGNESRHCMCVSHKAESFVLFVLFCSSNVTFIDIDEVGLSLYTSTKSIVIFSISSACILINIFGHTITTHNFSIYLMQCNTARVLFNINHLVSFFTQGSDYSFNLGRQTPSSQYLSV